MINRVELIGYLGADPEVRNFQDGGKIANLRLATSEVWRNKTTGERQERTEWHRVTVRSEGLVRVAEQFTRKGSLIRIEGKLQTRKWQDQNGQDRYSTEVSVGGYDGKIKLFPSGDGSGGSHHNGSSGGQSSQPQDSGGRPDLDDEIPF